MNQFDIKTDMTPQGDQPQAIEALAAGLGKGKRRQTLLGVTGSGKTFTLAHVIARTHRPTLVISHNKTLAAQLYEEFRELFPNNAVEYFVSYYDYYQPEAYIPQRDIYIEKEVERNDDLDRLRLSATTSLTGRRDVVIVASVSAIFGLGSPEEYKRSVAALRVGEHQERDELLERLADMQYQRSSVEFDRARFRVRGDVVELWPAYEKFAYRIEFFGDEIERLSLVDPASGKVLAEERRLFIYPAVHYVMPAKGLDAAMTSIRAELDQRLGQLKGEGKLLEAQRLAARTRYDLEMLHEVGYCPGVENYSRHLDGREPGSRSWTLLDYFPDDYLLIIDESHVTIPQLKAMYFGDRRRKETLVEHGFRLPSCLDNRPLMFAEFEKMLHQVIFVSATPGPYELEQCKGHVVEQIIRPTGLIDPVIHVRSAREQVSDLHREAVARAERKERVLVTTLTKRLAEQLAGYFRDEGLRCRYLHSEIDTLERIEILKALRKGEFDVLVGINLLREGLDLPEVSMVAIFDADKEGFLRSETSLIQTIGRTARNVNAEVILYADTVTHSMRNAIDETNRRRTLQQAYNREHHITPTTIRKAIRDGLTRELAARRTARKAVGLDAPQFDRKEMMRIIEQEMQHAAGMLEFEKAAKLRDRLKRLKDLPTLTADESILAAACALETDNPDYVPGVSPPRKHKRKSGTKR